MAFKKTSISVTKPLQTESPFLEELLPRLGEEREGKFWDGEKWVSKEEWEASLQSSPEPT